MTEEEHDHHRQIPQRAPCRMVGAMLDVHRERQRNTPTANMKFSNPDAKTSLARVALARSTTLSTSPHWLNSTERCDKEAAR